MHRAQDLAIKQKLEENKQDHKHHLLMRRKGQEIKANSQGFSGLKEHMN